MDGLHILPTADFTGTANLQITTNDLAPALAGGPIVVSNNVAINVSAPPIAAEIACQHDHRRRAADGDGGSPFGRLGRQRQLRGRLVELEPRQRLGRLRPTVQRGRSALGEQFQVNTQTRGRPEGRQGRHARRRHLRRHLDGKRRRRPRHGRRLSANVRRRRQRLAGSRGSGQRQQHGRRPDELVRDDQQQRHCSRLDEPESRRAIGTCSAKWYDFEATR